MRLLRGHVFVVVVLLAGCGGQTVYTVSATDACLTGKGAVTSTSDDDLDYIAQAASEGAIYTTAGTSHATIVFSRAVADAKNVEAGYAMFAKGFGGSTDGLLDRHGNAVISWDETPTDRERAAIEACLS